MNPKFSFLLALASLASAAKLGQFGNQQSEGTSAYKYSNDTITLVLAESMENVLHGAVGSTHKLEFILKNNGMAGHFSIDDYSEDGFTGTLSTKEAYLNAGQQQTITVRNLRVPNRPEGTKIRYTINVEKDSGTKRRKRQVGGGGGLGSGDEDGNINFPNLPNFNFNNNHPSNRKTVSTSVEFTVTSDSIDDGGSPKIKDIKYGADDKESACAKNQDTNCEQLWWLTFNIQDEKSGLNKVTVMPEGGSSEVYFKTDNFAYGTDDEVEVLVGASCCTSALEIRVTDIDGNQSEYTAKSTKTGSPMSSSLKWGLIGGGIALGLIIIVILVVVCMKKGYGPV